MKLAKCKSVAQIAAVVAAGSLAVAAEPPALKIIQTTQSNFPPGLLSDGITSGQVRAVLHVDVDGRLADYLVLAYTHRALASELAVALTEWQFEVPQERGEPVGIRTVVVFNFEARGAVLSLTAVSSASPISRWLPDPEISVLCEPRALDRPLQAVRTAPPIHPGRHLRPAQPQGTAVIDFYVDTDGRPRMPVVVTATHDAFGAAASDAVAQWRFVPPTHDGNPVLVRVRQQFVFNENS